MTPLSSPPPEERCEGPRLDPIAVALLRSDGLTRRSVEAVLAWVNQALQRAPAAAPKPAVRSIIPLRQVQERGAAVVTVSADDDAKLVLTRAND